MCNILPSNLLFCRGVCGSTNPTRDHHCGSGSGSGSGGGDMLL